MVRFLLENSLGAWWAARHPDSPLVKGFEYLRFDDAGKPAGADDALGWVYQFWQKDTFSLAARDAASAARRAASTDVSGCFRRKDGRARMTGLR